MSCFVTKFTLEYFYFTQLKYFLKNTNINSKRLIFIGLRKNQDSFLGSSCIGSILVFLFINRSKAYIIVLVNFMCAVRIENFLFVFMHIVKKKCVLSITLFPEAYYIVFILDWSIVCTLPSQKIVFSSPLVLMNFSVPSENLVCVKLSENLLF